MIFFLYGRDAYRIKKKIEEIIFEYRNKYSGCLNLSLLDMTEDDISDVRKAIDIVPMFAEKKLIILSNVFAAKAEKDDLVDYLKDNDAVGASDVILVVKGGDISAGKLKNDKLLKFFLEKGKCQEFKLFNIIQLKKWIITFLDKDGIQITEKALADIMNCVGNDLWQMEQELLKLSSSVLFEGKKVVEEYDVNNLVKSKIVTDIFDTVDSLAKKERSKTLNALNRHIRNGDDMLYVLSMFIYQFRNIIRVKSLIEDGGAANGALGKLKMHPYVLRKSTQQAAFFSFNELKKIYRMMLQVDLSIKTGRIQPDTALDLLVTEITK